MQHIMETEVATELRRSVAQKQASVALDSELASQLAEPRRPSVEVAAGIANVVTSLDHHFGRAQNIIAAQNEQVSRVARHLMKTEVGVELTR
jgi:hypothetical protein